MKTQILRYTYLTGLILAATLVRGDILREYWLNLPGVNVADLTNYAAFPNSPSGSNYLTSLEGPVNWNSNYGTRIRGYVTPPTSGSYVFWISSDDASELFLSSDSDPDNESVIASVPGWTNSREWTKYPSQQSAPINLVAGTNYYIEVLHKQGGGGDNVAVGWAKPGNPTTAPSEIIPGTVLTPWTGGAGLDAKPVITTGPDLTFAQAPVSYVMSATAADDGLPLPANPANPDPNDPHQLRWHWSVLSQPANSQGVVWSCQPSNGEAFTYSGSPNPPMTVFTCAPTATFDVPGIYRLNFSASDGQKTNNRPVTVLVGAASDYHQAGYLYLSPLPGAEYTSPQTEFLLVRFQNVAPSAVTNLSSFIQVIGRQSGAHSGTTHVAGDGRTVIFDMAQGFQNNEMVNVQLTPGLAPGTTGTLSPYLYTFMISTHMPDTALITARGDTPPCSTRFQAFDSNPSTKWDDQIVPNGTTNFTWIQYLYPGSQTHLVNAYTIVSAADTPADDPSDWRFYGVDASSNLTMLHSVTGEVFAGRNQTNTYSVPNVNPYRGYRLEVRRVADPINANGIQLAELSLFEPHGSILREYWTNIAGTAVSDLTNNPAYPNSPSARDSLSSFEAPSNWADNYGTRIRGYLTAPLTGNYTFWIASDDNSALFLSSNDSPTNSALIARVSSWTNPRQWNLYPEQKSAAIPLVAGQRYYIEALQKEGSGGDNVAVGWARPGDNTSTPFEVVPGWVLTPWTNTGAIIAALPPAPPSTARTISNSALNPLSVKAGVAAKGIIMPNGVSVPSDFPQVTITVRNNPAPDYIWMENVGPTGQMYQMILDTWGNPVYYQRGGARDFKMQDNGMITWAGFVGYDKNFNYVRSYGTVNGYGTDDHELRITADGTYYLIGDTSETVDMSRYIAGGNTSASVLDNVVQQFTPAGELIFQWRAWDHIDIRGQQQFIDLTSANFDFPHMNSVDVDDDGHILLSSRSTSECTKFNRDTGDVIWRLGGAYSTLTFVNDPLNGPANQHSFRSLGHGHYILFDDGNIHNPSVSRAVEYLVDPVAKTATLVWQFRDTPDKYAWYMGNVQRLTNGNTHINWVLSGYPKAVEVDSNGVKQLEMSFTQGSDLYRSWRSPWNGVVSAPYLIAESYPDNVSLIFNKFGDTNVAFYRIYGGTVSGSTNLLATSVKTLKQLTSLQNGSTYYFRVTAVNQRGVESPYSNEASVLVNIVGPGQNMVQNGDFSQGTASWVFTNSGTANATWSTPGATSYVHIVSAGTALNAIQLHQSGLPLIQGKKYVLQFDAWASVRRLIEVRLGQDASPFNIYRLFDPTLTTSPQRFAYTFTMSSSTDLNTRLTFNFGGSLGDVYLDNVVLFNSPPGDINSDGQVDLLDLKLFTTDWLKQQSGLGGDLDGNGKVDFNDFGILGENWSSP